MFFLTISNSFNPILMRVPEHFLTRQINYQTFTYWTSSNQDISLPGRFPTKTFSYFRHFPTLDISLPRLFLTRLFATQTFPYQDFSLFRLFPTQTFCFPRHFPTIGVSLPRLFPAKAFPYQDIFLQNLPVQKYFTGTPLYQARLGLVKVGCTFHNRSLLSLDHPIHSLRLVSKYIIATPLCQSRLG